MFINLWLKFAISTLLVGLLVAGGLIPGSATAAGPQTSNVYAPFGCNLSAGECNVVGTSQLVRTPKGVSMNIRTTGLEAGAAYTVWWVIFNYPEFCGDPCDANDLLPNGGDPRVESSVLWATGHVVGDDGRAGFAGHLQVGNPPGQVMFGPGLLEAQGAEVHLILRTHGLPIPGRVDEQISTFEGGCEVNVCANQQFAMHR